MTEKRSDFKKFKEKALQIPEVKAEYNALSTAFEMKRQMIALRKEAGVTQEEMADLLGTKKTALSQFLFRTKTELFIRRN